MKSEFMAQAIKLAEQGVLGNKGGPFGAIIVSENKIVGYGNNQVTSSNDPTAHAEVVAIRNACKLLNTFSLEKCEIYTSCEPCPMCLSAIYWARIPTIYYGATREDAKEIGFDDSYFYDQVCRDVNERDIVMKNFMRDESLVPFHQWQKKTDKILY